jgi:formate dehydrogenase gamma subunit
MRRFHSARIVEHWVHVLTFVALACTGLAQKFYYLDASQWLILHLGGIDRVRLIHRFAGILCSVSVFAHIISAIIGIVVKKWQPSMVITKKDFTDLIHNLRYYLGVENVPALGDRYTYKQKFEYWGILTGVLLMIASGLILWFPVTVTRFLPGEIIPTAKVLHTNEAMMILLIISIWHIYNALFSPEVFPLDTSILSGSITRERMLREHPLELAALEGKAVEDLVARRPEDTADRPGGVDTVEKTEEG